MSEDPNALPGEPDSVNPQQPAEPVSAEPQQEPAQPAPSEFPQYPPLPSFYEQAAPQDPYSAPIIAPPAGYGAPPLTPPPGFGAPPAGYAAMPPYMPPPGYAPPAGYAMPPYGYAPPPGYGFAPLPPPTPPLPLGQAIRELPSQYKKIIRKPSAWSFATEQTKAEWGIIWMQLLFLAGLQLITALISFLITSSRNTAVSPDSSTVVLATIAAIEPIALAILVPASFFAGAGIQYLMAKMFKGTGQFKQQAYNQLLYQMPMTVLGSLISLPVILLSGSTSSMLLPFSSTASSVPVFNPLALIGLILFELVGLGIFVYSIILNVHAIMAAHRLSGGKATGVVLIPYGIVVVLYIVAIFVFVAVALSSIAQP